MRTKLVAILSLLPILLIGVSAFAQSGRDAASRIVQASTVHRFADSSLVVGSDAYLSRYDNGVAMVIMTNDLTPDEVYTAEWVIFNAPENCSNGVCDIDDIFVVTEAGIPRDANGNILWQEWEARRFRTDGGILRNLGGDPELNVDGIAAAKISVQHAAGSYTPDGQLTVSASLGEGETSGIIIGPGLLDAQTAEIHLFVRAHGPSVEDAAVEQLSTFGGACEPKDAYPCDDVQYTVFAPVGG